MVQAGMCGEREPEETRCESFSFASTPNVMRLANGRRSRRHLRAVSSFRILRNALALVVLLTVCSTCLWAQPPNHVQRATVRFLATSTVYRTTWGMDEDDYLTAVKFPKSGSSVLARLVDEYSNWAPPIPAVILKSDNGTRFYLLRDPDCDIPFREMLLRTAPGDPMAILPEKLEYHPHLRNVPAPGTILPCYLTVRRDTKRRFTQILSAIFLWR